MFNGIEVIAGCMGLLAVLATVEAIRLRRSQRRVPIRIHVNGTRGKSSVTRLIAAALREAGIRTVAKTTGTLPRVILPDGSELPIDRKSKANVIEQRDVANIAATAQAEALVVECMALQPQLQTLSETTLVRATHGVITNCRADHLDVMGPTERDVACALSNMTPVRGKLFTAETKHLDVLRAATQDRQSELLAVSPEEIAEVTDLEMAGFRFEEHKENVALALRVCADLGIDRATALRGMQQATPDPGAMTRHVVEFFGREVVFVNAFAANDPASTEGAWRRALDGCSPERSRIAIVNCRLDRAGRSIQIARAMVDWPAPDHVVLVRTGTRAFVRAARAAGMDPRTFITAEGCEVAELFELVVEHAQEAAVVVGMGNIGDAGLDIARYFRNRSRLSTERTPVKPVLPADRSAALARNGVAIGEDSQSTLEYTDVNHAATLPEEKTKEKMNGHALAKVNGFNGTHLAHQLARPNGNGRHHTNGTEEIDGA